jgi:hypothetical protein
MIKLIVYIVGLSGLINFPISGGRQAMDVVFLNAKFDRELNLPEHKAKLHIDIGRSNSTDVDLSQYAVTVHCGDGTKDDLSRGLKTVQQDDEMPWSGLKWIPDMAKIAVGAQTRTGYMRGGDGRVSAALRLIQGTVQGAPPTRSAGASALFRIGTQRQALTDRIQYTLECRTAEVEFHLHPFAGGETKIVKVAPSKPGATMLATISNLPASMSKMSMAVGQPQTHVKAGFPLLRTKPSKANIPSLDECDAATCDNPWVCPMFHIPDPSEYANCKIVFCGDPPVGITGATADITRLGDWRQK